VIDLVFIGDFNKNYLSELVEKAERVIRRKIRYLIYASDEIGSFDLKDYVPAPLLLWEKSTDNR
jgi:hypothetical protein